MNSKRLYGNEIPENINFTNPALVILNACETGTVAVSIGDEINGLCRGFIQAGSKGIISNSWSVFDSSSADLIKEFYKIFLKGNSISYSLKEARRHIRKKVRNSKHDWFGDLVLWGSYVYYGNPALRIQEIKSKSAQG